MALRKSVYRRGRLREDVPHSRAVGALLLVALLFVSVPPGSAENTGITMRLASVQWVYGPEAWKDDAAWAPAPAAPAGFWRASLGLRLEVAIELELPASPAQKEVTATLTDGLTVVEGARYAGAQQHVFYFDVDGQRGVGPAAATAPLAATPWTLEVTAQESAGPGGAPFPLGNATARILPMGVSLEGALLNGATAPAIRVPEAHLPRFRDVAAGPDVWLPSGTLGPSHRLVPRVATGIPGASVEWTAWAARGDPVRVPELPDSPGQPTPVDGVAADLAAGATRFVQVPLGSTVADDRGIARVLLEASELADAVGVAQDLLVVSATTQQGNSGGGVAFLVGFAPDAPAVRGFAAPQPGEVGSLGVGVDVSANGTAAGFGEVLALTTTGGEGGERGEAAGRLLARAPLAFLPDATGRAYLDTRPLRASAESGYRVVAFLETPLGDYAGHATALRGLEPRLQIPQLGVGEESVVRLDLRNRFSDGRTAVAPGHDVAALVALEIDRQPLGDRLAAVPEGGTLATNWLVSPPRDGSVDMRVTVDTGDLLFEQRKSVDVLTREAYEQQRAPWYDPDRLVPSPAIGLALLAIAMAALVRRPPSRNG